VPDEGIELLLVPLLPVELAVPPVVLDEFIALLGLLAVPVKLLVVLPGSLLVLFRLELPVAVLPLLVSLVLP
jgi:hypothetical protein